MSLSIELPVGLTIDGQTHKNVELLPTNGIAEKVFTKKLAEKPYTWQGNVLSVAIKSIGDILIGAKVREEYLNDNTVTIPEAIKKLTLADTNTLLVEIHRKCWESNLPKQEFVCKFCSKRVEGDIDLQKIKMLDEDIEFLEKSPDLSQIVVYLKHGLLVSEIKDLAKREDYAPYLDLRINKLTFRTPLLKDAINNEKYTQDTVVFWRRIAFDCLEKLEMVENPDTIDEKVIDELPASAISFMGMRLYDLYLVGADLKNVREELTEYLPTLPFYYLEECPCERNIEIPYVMEASNFFSE